VREPDVESVEEDASERLARQLRRPVPGADESEDQPSGEAEPPEDAPDGDVPAAEAAAADDAAADAPQDAEPATPTAAAAPRAPTGVLPALIDLTPERTWTRKAADPALVTTAVAAVLLLVLGLSGVTWALVAAAVLGILAGTLLASRISRSSVARVLVNRGQIEVERPNGWRRYDLLSAATEVLMTGKPGHSGWKVELTAEDGSHCVLDESVVDPAGFVRVLRHYRPGS